MDKQGYLGGFFAILRQDILIGNRGEIRNGDGKLEI